MARQLNIAAEAVYREAEKLFGKKGKPMRLSALARKVNKTLHTLDPGKWNGEMSERDLVMAICSQNDDGNIADGIMTSAWQMLFVGRDKDLRFLLDRWGEPF